MRYLSAQYIFPVSAPPLKYGIICVNDDGCIVDVIDTGGNLKDHEKLEFYDGILVPGFVNAHCHLELSHLHGVMKTNIGLPGFISSIRKLRQATDETILAAAKAADDEMKRNGIVAVGDISNNACTFPVKRDSPIRYHTFVEVFGLDDNLSEEIISTAEQIEQEYRNAGMPVSIVPHASYSVSQTLWEMLQQSYASSPPQVVSIHHQESSDEFSICDMRLEMCDMRLEISDMRCAVSEIKNKKIKIKILLVHNIFSTINDLSKYTSYPETFYYILCPGSNLFIQNQLPGLLLFSSPEFCNNVCLGTDSLASNTSLSVLEEMKIIQQHTSGIPLEMLVQWATLNGARALGFDHFLGSFEKGKKPGVNMISGIDPEEMRLTAQTNVKVLVEN